MSDNFLPPEGFSEGSITGRSERRAFLRRAVGVGVPVVLATVRGRSVLAQDVDPTNQTDVGSGCLSWAPSGWLQRDGDVNYNYEQRLRSCEDFANQDVTTEPSSVTEPTSDPLLAPVEEDQGGKGYGQGGKKK